MDEGFTVDYDVLAEVATALGTLKDEFESIADDVDGDGQATGHGRLAEALGVFGTNWSNERHKIIGSLEEASRYSQAAADTYRETDTGLSDELDPR